MTIGMATTPARPPMSPNILTPPSDTPLDKQTYSFPKQAIQPKIASHGPGGESDSELSRQPSLTQQKPLSLLTTLLHSPDIHNNKKGNPPSISGVSSARSSAPSTAISSPSGGILHHSKAEALPHTTSILRRGSASEVDGPIGLGLLNGHGHGLEGLAGRLEKVEEKRERIGWADQEPPPVARTPSTRVALKFAVAPPHSTGETSVRHKESSPALDKPVTPGSEDGSPKYRQSVLEDSDDSDDSRDSDDGYEEDEEDGYSAEEGTGLFRSEAAGAGFPFARSTNYKTSERRGSSPPALAVLPAPPRRGRGHVRVVDGNAESKKCSRHCSPPPSISRSGSEAPNTRRSDYSDAGPRDGRAGSPMPSRLSVESDEEEEEEASPVNSRGGWRSDDAAFAPIINPIRADAMSRNVSAPPTAPAFRSVFDESDTDATGRSLRSGVQGFLRRASEHLSGARRPEVPTSPRESGSPACPPALDVTPATATSISRPETGNHNGGVEHRLEQTLSKYPVDLSRTQSLSSKVTFQPPVKPIRRERHRSSSSANAIPSCSGPISCPRSNKPGEENLGWSEGAIRSIRRTGPQP